MCAEKMQSKFRSEKTAFSRSPACETDLYACHTAVNILGALMTWGSHIEWLPAKQQGMRDSW